MVILLESTKTYPYPYQVSSKSKIIKQESDYQARATVIKQE
jgi:hypothetical protein